MARVRCNSCQGVYDTEAPDGARYFHVCPPLSVVELDAAVKAGRVVVPAGETVAEAIQRRRYVRAQARDETIVPDADPTQPAHLKAEGRGVTPADDVVVDTAPVVVP